MTTEMSKTQIDRLGDRLRKGDISEADLRLLDTYRRSFSEAYESCRRSYHKGVGAGANGKVGEIDHVYIR